MEKIKPNIDRQKEIIRMREVDGMTLKAIGKVFGISRQRVSMILKTDYNGTNHYFGAREKKAVTNNVVYKELKEKMLKSHVSIHKMAKDLNVPYSSMQLKLNGSMSLSIEEYDIYLDYLDRFARTYRKEYEYANRRH